MTEREALLAAVAADPDSDLPRLAFADWLDDHGDPDRAEFIRLQCALDVLLAGRQLPDTDWFRTHPEADITRLKRAVAVLRSRLGRRWAADLPSPVGTVWSPDKLERGFHSHVSVPDGWSLVGHADELFRASPVRHLDIRRLDAAAHLAPVAGRTGLRSVGIQSASPAAMDGLLAGSHLDDIPHLGLITYGMPDREVERLLARFGQRVGRYGLVGG